MGFLVAMARRRSQVAETEAPAEAPPAPEAALRPGDAARDGEEAGLRRFVIEAARLLSDRHCEDIRIFDVRGLSQLTDYIVIATGTSDRQMKSVGSEVADMAREQGLSRYGTERDGSTTWVVLDFVHVMVHLFEPATRAHYDLEMLWGDAPTVEWRR